MTKAKKQELIEKTREAQKAWTLRLTGLNKESRVVTAIQMAADALKEAHDADRSAPKGWQYNFGHTAAPLARPEALRILEELVEWSKGYGTGRLLKAKVKRGALKLPAVEVANDAQ